MLYKFQVFYENLKWQSVQRRLQVIYDFKLKFFSKDNNYDEFVLYLAFAQKKID